MSGITKESVLVLSKGVRIKQDQVRDRTVLLGPERTLGLDGSGIAIIELVDGKRSIAKIVSDLAEKYDAPAQTIGNDVVAFLRDLINRGYLDFSDGS